MLSMPKSCTAYISEINPPFKSTNKRIRMKNNKTTNRLPDPKWAGLSSPLQGYLDTRGKTPSLWSGHACLIGKGTDPKIWDPKITEFGTFTY